MMANDVVRDRLMASPRRSASALKVLKLLKEHETRPVAKTPATTTVSEALRLWRTRLKNTEFTQAPLEGVEDLLHGLEQLAPQRKVDQFGFVGPKSAMTVFFTRTGGAYVGSAIIARSQR